MTKLISVILCFSLAACGHFDRDKDDDKRRPEKPVDVCSGVASMEIHSAGEWQSAEVMPLIKSAFDSQGLGFSYTITPLKTPLKITSNWSVQYNAARAYMRAHHSDKCAAFVLVYALDNYGPAGLASGTDNPVFIGYQSDFTPLYTARVIAHELGHYCRLPHAESPTSVLGPNIDRLEKVDYSPIEWEVIRNCF